MRKLLSFILCVIMVCSVLTLTSCKDKQAVGESWQIKSYVSDEAYEQKVGFKVTRNSKSIKDVWINVAKIDGESIKLSFCKYKTSSDKDTDLYENGSLLDDGPRVITAQQVKDANKNSKGWIKVNAKDWNLSNDSVLMIIEEGKATLREIVFVDVDGKRLSASIYKARVVIETKENKNPLAKEFTSSELSAFAETSIYGIPNFLLDNQESFDNKDKED